MHYYFILGRENKISQKEIESVLAGFDFYFPTTRDLKYSTSILNQEVLEIKFCREVDDEITKLINILGGTVKIFKKIANASKDNLVPECVKIIKNFQGKVLFGISEYSQSRSDILHLGLEIKKNLKESGKSSRYIAGKEQGRLSSAQSFHYKFDREGIEIGIFANGIGQLIAVQNIDEWSRRDYGKPCSDARSGMLPPKLARMMVNIALSTSKSARPLLIDPFCGSGNILIEGLTLGLDVMGSDISEKAVEDSKTNVVWFAKKRKASISQADATKDDFGKIGRSFFIVTEPYLGQPRRHKLSIEEEKEARENISRLYLDFLENLSRTASHEFLTTTCLVFPLLELANGEKLSIYKLCIDKIKNLGYILSYPPLIYGRDYQIVKREIVLLVRK